MKKHLLIAILILLVIAVSNAQWQPDFRLTNNIANSETSLDNSARCVESIGDDVHVVWWDTRDGNEEIYYKRSTDGGLSWGTETRLTNNNSISWYPSVSVSGSAVHVVWQDNRDGNFEIYYKRSTDAGISWGAETRLTNSVADSFYPCASLSGSAVHIVWDDTRDGNNEIYYKRSTDGGLSWGADIRLTNNIAISRTASVSVSGQVVHVVWEDDRDGNKEEYYKRSTDGGISWGADTRLTNAPGYSSAPSVSVSGSAVHVVWHDEREDFNGRIYYKRSTDGGISWGADTRLTNDPAYTSSPSLFVSGPGVHVVWVDQRDGNFEIYYKQSADGGVSWGEDTRLTNNSFLSLNPFVSVSGSCVHVVWRDNRDGNYEIYYKRNPTGNPVGIFIINSGFPQKYELHQNYPNPFNPSTTIKFEIPIEGNVSLKVYNITGREVKTLINNLKFNRGIISHQFDISELASGVYFYSLIFNGNIIDTKKMILVK